MEKNRDNNDKFLFYERVMAHLNSDSALLNSVRGETARSFKGFLNGVDEGSAKKEKVGKEGSAKPFDQVLAEVLRVKKV